MIARVNRDRTPRLISRFQNRIKYLRITTYLHQDESVSTVSCKMLLVASASVPPRVVDQILTAIATHIPDLIARHPIASEIDLKKRPTVAEGMSIELHPGAEMFYERASRRP